MKNVLVIAPHPDDETLGCGGTLLRHRGRGDNIHWLIVTQLTAKAGYTRTQMTTREAEIAAVAEAYEFSSVSHLDLPTSQLDTLPLNDIITKIGEVFDVISPNTIYLPSPNDVHSDHHVTFDATAACCKWFRYPSLQQISAYETLSETDFGLKPWSKFYPNLFVNISYWLENKMDIMKMYGSEMGAFPFPRSEQAIQALANLRGSQSGCISAEAFMILKEIQL